MHIQVIIFVQNDFRLGCIVFLHPRRQGQIRICEVESNLKTGSDQEK